MLRLEIHDKKHSEIVQEDPVALQILAKVYCILVSNISEVSSSSGLKAPVDMQEAESD